MEEKLPAGAERSERRRPPGPKEAPWLVFPCDKCGKDEAFYNLCEPNNKLYRKFIPEMSRKLYWQKPSHQGWLVILCDDGKANSTTMPNWNLGDCFLWNPLSMETIELPSLLHYYESTQYIADCVLTSPPSNPDDSMVFFLFTGYGNISDQIFYCRPGKDKHWRTKELSVKKNTSQQLFCFNGKLYIFCWNDPLIEIGWSKYDDDDDGILSIRSIDVIDESKAPIVVSFDVMSKQDYVQSCDELFKVVRYGHPTTFEKQVIAFKVFKMNLSIMAWEEVKDLGDHVLFLGETTIACCSAAELGLIRGCLHFTLSQDKSLYQFDLKDGTISVSLPCPDLPTPWFSPNWVMIPTTVSETDKLGNKVEKDIIVEDEKIETKEEEEGHKNNGRELEGSRTWSSLNEDILYLIASYLHPVDYLHFRAVCKRSRSASPVMGWRTSSAEIKPTTYLSPWLVFKTSDCSYNFLDPTYNDEKYYMNMQDLLLDAEIRFSKGSWLLMSKGKRTIFCYNPFTREKIQLPDLLDDCDFSGISFSSLPTSSDCVIFAVSDAINKISISFISRKDGSWIYDIMNYNDLPREEKSIAYRPCYNNPVFCNGVFYCLDYKGALGSFDLNKEFPWEFLDKPQTPCNSIHQSFLVECEGRLLSVFLGNLGEWVRVFRLDFSNMAWVEVQSLGNHMLFISNTSTLSAVAPNSHMKNKIYFPRYHGEGIVFYSLDTCMFHSQASRHSAKDFYNTKEQLYSGWIEPNWSQSTDQELDWQLART